MKQEVREMNLEDIFENTVIGTVLVGLGCAGYMALYSPKSSYAGKQQEIEDVWDGLIERGYRPHSTHWAGYDWDCIDEDKDGLGDICKSLDSNPVHMYTIAMKPRVGEQN